MVDVDRLRLTRLNPLRHSILVPAHRTSPRQAHLSREITFRDFYIDCGTGESCYLNYVVQSENLAGHEKTPWLVVGMPSHPELTSTRKTSETRSIGVVDTIGEPALGRRFLIWG